MSDQTTIEPFEESNKRAVGRFYNWPMIGEVIMRERGTDDFDLVMTMLGTWAPDLAPEATEAELQKWFGFEDWQMHTLTSKDATHGDFERLADWLVEAERAQ